MKTVHIKVHGRVQGVFFRQDTKDRATALRITGWVRNLPDGTVEITATGDEQNIEKLIQWCQQGPPRAVVNKVDVTDSPLNNFTSFEIVRL